ncbi:uncharacterized protein [Periplaneta americana]|uniref:uncharacterized protein n=1 Tax=Periplaneta americana TaxID=6978 RepID=UPI0037E8D1A1
MATGGGPPVIVEDIDPTVAQISPHIMVHIPGAIDSDMLESELEVMFAEEVQLATKPSEDVSPSTAGPANSVEAETETAEMATPTASIEAAAPRVQTRKHRNVVFKDQSAALLQLEIKKTKLELETAEIMLRVAKKKEQLIDIELAKAQRLT